MTHMNRLADRRENRLMVAKVRQSGVGMNGEFGTSRCTLSCIEWINNKVLLYTKGNYIQYPVINQDGEEYERYIHYIYL